MKQDRASAARERRRSRRPSGLLSRREFIGIAAGGIAAGSIGFPAIGRCSPRVKSVIVLGMDGMDPALLLRLIGEGKMRNVRRLIETGCFAPLGTSDPPQSPVAWSNFISGTNPGGHGIYDFIARDPATMTPCFSMSRVEGGATVLPVSHWRIPLAGGKVRNLRRGPTFWKDLCDRGIDCTVFRMPANFPPTPCAARSISGLGTPDVHGSYGIFTLYTDKTGLATKDVSGGRIERVRIRDRAADCVLYGPVNSLDRDGAHVNIPFRIHVDPENAAALIRIQGREVLLAEGEWSDWVEVSFALMPHLAEVRGAFRFFLKKARDDFALYASPVNMDPRSPSMPISTPSGYSRRLAEEVGRFYTQGMAEDTSALSAGALDDDEYRHQAGYVLDESLRLFDHEFERFKTGFFFFYFSSLDLNSHAFWRAMDAGHPLYSEELRRKHGDFIPWLYEQADAVIGRAMRRMGDDALLMVISDHGFASFRRQFNLNSWLMDSGYATQVSGVPRGQRSFFADVEWSRTRAYGLGMNGLYLNLKGREKYGVVAPGEARDALESELVARLTAVRDPKTGERVISNAYRSREIYRGPYVADAPDIVVCYNRNYRASWDTVLGKYPVEHVLDNADPWSGDHALDAAFMSGVFVCNRKIKTDHPALSDLAPTILTEFGLPAPPGMTGTSVL